MSPRYSARYESEQWVTKEYPIIPKPTNRQQRSTGRIPLEDLDVTSLKSLVQTRGLDETTQVLYQSIRESAVHGPAIKAIDRMCDPLDPIDGNVKVIIVPGLLYREYPGSGADGRMLIEATRQLGWDYEVISTASTGRLVDNAEVLLRYLKNNSNRPLVLASISKGGAEIAAAMQLDPLGQQFASVVGWVDVCGMIHGSPVIDFISRQRLRMLGFRALFALRRWTLASVLDLRYDGMLAADFEAPDHIKIVHAVGFPSEEDFTLEKLRRFHRQIGALGPNDGVILLHDSLRAPGIVYPVRGADHYMRPRFQVQPLCRGFLRYAAGHQPSEEQK